MYESLIKTFFIIFIACFLGTLGLTMFFRFLGVRGYLNNLFPNVRGGIPRGIGLVPFLILCFLFLPQYNDLVLIIGIFAFIDDLVGRKQSKLIGMEWGQLSRGIGILLVFILAYYAGLGWSAILLAFLIQPFNISDMQPGSTCIVTITMSILTIILMLLVNSPPIYGLPAIYTPLLILIVCLAYCPLDFAGKIMMGEVGNHSFGVALGVAFYLIGGVWWLLALTIISVLFIAFIRRNTLNVFFEQKLGIFYPVFGDYVMDVITGGGLGDFIRRLIFKDKQYEVKNTALIMLGFRRLLYNPYAKKYKGYN